VKRAVISVLRLARRLIRKEDIAPQVLDAVRLLSALPLAVEVAMAEQISAGISAMVKEDAIYIERNKGWDALLGVLVHCRRDKRALRHALQCSGMALNITPVISLNSFIPVLRLATEIATWLVAPEKVPTPTPVARTRSGPSTPPVPAPPEKSEEDAKLLLEVLYTLHERASLSLGDIDSVGLWSDVWRPLLFSIASLESDVRFIETDPRRGIRQSGERSVIVAHSQLFPYCRSRFCLSTWRK
jgi:hypothetical protein